MPLYKSSDPSGTEVAMGFLWALFWCCRCCLVSHNPLVPVVVLTCSQDHSNPWRWTSKTTELTFSGCETLWTLCFGPVYQHQFTVSCIVGLLRKAIALNSIGFAKRKRDVFGLALGLRGHGKRCCLLSLTVLISVCWNRNHTANCASIAKTKGFNAPRVCQRHPRPSGVVMLWGLIL